MLGLVCACLCVRVMYAVGHRAESVNGIRVGIQWTSQQCTAGRFGVCVSVYIIVNALTLHVHLIAFHLHAENLCHVVFAKEEAVKANT